MQAGGGELGPFFFRRCYWEGTAFTPAPHPGSVHAPHRQPPLASPSGLGVAHAGGVMSP